MRLLKYITIILILFSCEKEEPRPERNVDLNNVIGNTYQVAVWGFKDIDAGDEYDLLSVNPECDTIYVHFGSTELLIVRVNGMYGLPSLYKKIKFTYEFEDDEIFLRRDTFTRWKITTLTNTRFNYEGMHDLHQQFQKVNIKFAKMTKHPEVVITTMGY